MVIVLLLPLLPSLHPLSSSCAEATEVEEVLLVGVNLVMGGAYHAPEMLHIDNSVLL
mgnify:CR=1 FL=1